MTIPLTWNDPSFDGLTDSPNWADVPDGGTLSNYSSTDDGPYGTVMLEGSATVNNIRINSDEGIRLSGGTITISNSFIETTGLPGDHADGIHACLALRQGLHRADDRGRTAHVALHAHHARARFLAELFY